MTALACKVLTPPQHLLTRPSKFMYKSISNAFHKMKLQKATVSTSSTKAPSLQYCWTRYYRKYYDAPFINYNFNIIRYKYKVDCL